MNGIKNGNVALNWSSHKQNSMRDLVVEVKLASLKINIAGENVIKNYILNKIASVVLFIIKLLDVAERHRNNASVFLCGFIRSLNKHRVFSLGNRAEISVCILSDKAYAVSTENPLKPL